MSLRALVTSGVAPYHLTVGDLAVTVKTHPRARRVTLRYDGKNAVFVVTTPKRTSKKFVSDFLTTHQDWMQRQTCKAAPRINPLENGIIMIQGIERRIVHEQAAGVDTILHEDRLIIRCRPERLQRALQRFVKQHAEHVIMPMVREKAAQIARPVTAVAFRDTTSRWGSCSHDGKLSFSWRLVMAPHAVIDYVVAHEVAHLQHFDHSKDFWSLCRSLSSDYTIGKHWLQLNGQSLQQIAL